MQFAIPASESVTAISQPFSSSGRLLNGCDIDRKVVLLYVKSFNRRVAAYYKNNTSRKFIVKRLRLDFPSLNLIK